MRPHFDIADPAHLTGAASVASATTSISLFGMNASELGVLVSAVVAMLTFILHMWYTLRKDGRAREIHKRRLELNDLDGTE